MLTDGLEWCGLLVDYCDVFISCLDSHSDGTHSLQSIHCWDTDAMLHFSKSDEETNSSTSWMAWGWVFIFGWTIPLRFSFYQSMHCLYWHALSLCYCQENALAFDLCQYEFNPKCNSPCYPVKYLYNRLWQHLQPWVSISFALSISLQFFLVLLCKTAPAQSGCMKIMSAWHKLSVGWSPDLCHGRAVCVWQLWTTDMR